MGKISLKYMLQRKEVQWSKAFMRLGLSIYKRREGKHLTKKQLAKKIGVDIKYIYQAERADIDEMPVDPLFRILKFLEINVLLTDPLEIEPMFGNIVDVKIYNRVLSKKEINKMYKKELKKISSL